MKRLSLAIFFFPVMASAFDLRTRVESERNLLGASGEMSSFSLDEGSIAGTGAKVDFFHALTSKIGLEMFVSSALTSGQGVSSSFTGLGGYGFYNLFTDCCARTRVVYIDGLPVASETQASRHLFQVGVGLNQYLLNGTRGVYSLSGPGFGVNYIVAVWGFRIKASGRFTQLISNETPVSGTTLSVGLVFPL